MPAFSPSEAFVCGLLHDLGKIALDAILPKSFARVVEAADLLRGNIADVERSVIGLDHMVAGKRLAERWELPTALRDCIWLHGQTPAALPATVTNPRMVNLITLADMLVREQHLGFSGNYTFTIAKHTLIDAIGLTAADQPWMPRCKRWSNALNRAPRRAATRAGHAAASFIKAR